MSNINKVDEIYGVKNKLVIDAREYGVVGDGTTDNTANLTTALQAAIDAGAVLELPSGVILCDGQVAVSVGTLEIVCIQGQGKAVTTLYFTDSVGTSVYPLHLTYAGGLYAEGGFLRDFSIKMEQPNSTNPGLMTAYKAAVRLDGGNNFKVENVNFVAVYDGISVYANNGIAIHKCNFSNFGRAIIMDRCLNAAEVSHCLIGWPVELTANQASAILNSSLQNRAFYIGHVDAIDIHSNVTILQGYTGYLLAGDDGYGATGTVHNNWFDGVGQWAISSAEVNFMNNRISVNTSFAGIAGLQFSGGCFRSVIQGNTFLASASAIRCIAFFPAANTVGTPSPGTPSLIVSDNIFITHTNDVNTIAVEGYTGFQVPKIGVVISNNYFDRVAGQTYAEPIIAHFTALDTGDIELTVVGNSVKNSVGGTGYFVYLSSDLAHNVEGNNCGGYAISAPAGSANVRIGLGNSNYTISNPVRHYLNGAAILKSFTYAALPTAVTGMVLYCSDGQATSASNNTLTNGGSGCVAFRINGAWKVVV